MIKNLEEIARTISDYKGITADSRKVKKGYIFVAIKGSAQDGHKYVEDAIKNGAVVVVGENPSAHFSRSGLKDVEYIKVDDSREALGELASAFYGYPSRKLKIIGVTGTKGKTTTVHIIHHILTKLGKKAGILSSIAVPGLHVTSPDVVTLNEYLKKFVDEGMEFVVIEVSSHGIDQKRIAGIKFDVGVLTNIAPEHLDYHKTLKEYRRVKMSFINSARYKIVSPVATNVKILPGLHNNLNVEAAIMTAEKFGITREKALEAAKSFELPEGRLSEVPNKLGIKIIIDFAHTPDSLEKTLQYLRSETTKRIVSVFGCAGERDTRKRFQMGKVSAKLADLSIFTAEDPRSENIVDILAKMSQGAKSVGAVEGKDFVKIRERGEAIAYAIQSAKKGDVLLIAGKGHEKSMAYGDYEHPWSDFDVVNNILNGDADISTVVLAAGKGSRMKSQSPKVLKQICGRPMIAYTLESLRKVGINDITAVVSFRKNLVMKEVGQAVKYAFQRNPKGGTADAAKVGSELISEESSILMIINGDDSAFYTPETIKKIIEIHKERGRILTFVSLMKDDPTGLGRIVRGEDGLITKIVEEKDATPEEKKIKEVNDGLYVFDRNWFFENINNVKKGPQGEYYINDLIKFAIDQKNGKMATYTLPNDDEWQGVNTPEQLEEANRKMAKRLTLRD